MLCNDTVHSRTLEMWQYTRSNNDLNVNLGYVIGQGGGISSILYGSFVSVRGPSKNRILS